MLGVLEELFGSGVWDPEVPPPTTHHGHPTLFHQEVARMSEEHLASSVEGLERLYTREQRLIGALRRERSRLQRLVERWRGEKEWVGEKEGVGELREEVAGLVLPGGQDQLRGALLGLYRVAAGHGLAPSTMTMGLLPLAPVHPLAAQDCRLVARVARGLGQLHHAVDWLMEAARLDQVEGKVEEAR